MLLHDETFLVFDKLHFKRDQGYNAYDTTQRKQNYKNETYQVGRLGPSNRPTFYNDGEKSEEFLKEESWRWFSYPPSSADNVASS